MNTVFCFRQYLTYKQIEKGDTVPDTKHTEASSMYRELRRDFIGGDKLIAKTTQKENTYYG